MLFPYGARDAFRTLLRERLAAHGCAALTADTVLLEIKPGPYAPLVEQDLAPRASPEGAAQCADFVRRFRAARRGDALRADRLIN